MRLHPLFATLLLPSLASPQVTVFEKDTGLVDGNVVILGPTPFSPPELRGLRLLHLELVGRTRLTEGLRGFARIERDVPGAARLVLPRGRGSLYKFRRSRPGGAFTFGYFLTTPDGMASCVFELPGSGFVGRNDPLPNRIAVEANGRSILVASSFEAGGDLWEIDLDVKAAINRTAQLPPRDFERSGMALLGTWGVGVSTSGVYRFERTPTDVAQVVPLPTSVSWFAHDVVQSEDGSTVAFIAGDTINRAYVFTCASQGSAVRVTDPPMRIPGAGFLPEDPSGPTLALSTDGSWVAWRQEAVSRECFVNRAGPGARPASTHVTGPSHFHDTLNDTGVISFFDADSMVFVVGRHAAEGIEQADVFRVDLAAGGFSAQNLTLTSWVLQPPYDYGTLRAWDGIFQASTAGVPTFLCFDRSLGGRLLTFDALGSVRLVIGQVDSLDSLDRAGDYLVAQVTRSVGVDLPNARSLNLVQIPPDGSASTVLPLLQGSRITRESSAPNAVFGGVLELTGGGELLGRINVPTPVGASSTGAPRIFGPTTWTALDGTLYATMRAAGNRRVVVRYSDTAIQTLRNSPSGTFVLPGS